MNTSLSEIVKMSTSEKGLSLIRYFEKSKNKPYQCPAKLWTVGYGHVIGDGKTLPTIYNRVFTQVEINNFLRQDVNIAENNVLKAITIELNQNQFDALVSFTFNLGGSALMASSVRSKLNRGDFQAALRTWRMYNKSKGIVLKGLILRREAEISLFTSI